MAFYRLFVPKQAVGANLKYFDFFNAAGSALIVYVRSVRPVVSGAVAVTGTVGVDLFLNRTSAVGTGGTAATNNGTALDACTFTSHDNSQVLTPSITARLAPSGGATAGAVISWASVFTEETNSSTYMPAPDLVTLDNDDVPPLMVREGTGIAVTQGSVASVGNIGFNVIFDVRQTA